MKNVIKPYIQPSFLICIAVLALAGAGKSTAIRLLGVQLTKKPIPLKKSLDLMDEILLLPYKVTIKNTIDNKDILEQLGTEEYIQWLLEDTEEKESSPIRYCSLFITYYTGNPDRVPHVPEECYVGGGNQVLAREMVSLNIGASKDSGIISETTGSVETQRQEKIRVRYLVFVGKSSSIWQMDSKYSVMYFFKANDEYAGNRTDARKIMGKNLFGKYSYFSKVEWKFYGQGYGGIVYPDKEEVISGSERLLSAILPILEREHWPDWEKAGTKK